MTTYILKTEQIRQNALKAVQDAELGKTVTIGDKNHTDAQRDFWHVLVRMLGNHLGYSEDDMKFLIKKDILGLRVVYAPDGSVNFVINETRKLNSDDYSDLIDKTYIYADIYDFKLPPASRYGIDL